MVNIKPGCLLPTSYVKTHFLPHSKHNVSNPKPNIQCRHNLRVFCKNNMTHTNRTCR